MSDTKPPATIDECAQIAYSLVMTTTGDPEVANIIRSGIHDAYRVGWIRPHSTAHAHDCMHAVAELQRLLNPHREEPDV